MSRFSVFSLRVRLFLLILAAIVPALVFQIFHTAGERRHSINHAREEALQLARLAAGSQKDLIEQTRQLLSVLAQFPAIRDGNADAASELLADILKNYPYYTTLLVVDLEGNVRSSAVPLKSPVSVTDRGWFMIPMQTMDFAVGEYQMGRVSGKASLACGYPIMGREGRLKGVIGTGLDTSWLNKLVTNIKVEQGTTITLIDRQGTVLARYPDPENWVGRATADPFIIQAIIREDGNDGTVEISGQDGKNYLYAYTAVRTGKNETIAYVYSVIPTSIIFARANMELGINLAVMGIIALMAFALAWVGGNHFVLRQVGALLSATKRLGTGDLAARTGLPHDSGEFGQLAKSFDNMAGSLQQQTEQLWEAKTKYQKNEELYRSIFESTTDCVMVWDRQYNNIYANQSAIDHVGAARDMVIGRNIRNGLGHIPEFMKLWMDRIDWVFNTREPMRAEDSVMVGNRIVYSESAISPIKDGEGNLFAVGVVYRDITDRKQAEEIRKLNRILEQRTVELEAVNKELEAFSYSVSHDLRAPLRSIDGFSLALLEDYPDKLDAQGKDHLRRVRAACQRMARLIDDLLNLSRLTRTEMCRENVDLSEIARSVAADLRSSQPERKIEFVIPDGIRAEGDARLLRVVMENLLGNAWKFTGNQPEARIEFGLEQQEGVPVYFVRDNGTGFDMAYVGKLFAPFQRLHGFAEFPGTGIGLATVQRIICRHGGRVWAEGDVDKGATFYFAIPDSGK